MVVGFDPNLILALNLAGTFAFGLSGGLAAVRARLDSSVLVCGALFDGISEELARGREILVGVGRILFVR